MKGRVLMNSNENVLALFLQIQKAYLKCCYDAVKDEPIKMTEMICILYLYDHAPNDTSNEIAKQYMLSRSLVSKTVDSLKTAGYLETERDSMDCRKIHLHLTEKCRPILEKIKIAKDVFSREMAKDVTAHETALLFDLAGKLRRNLNGIQNQRAKRYKSIHIEPDTDAYFDWTMKG